MIPFVYETIIADPNISDAQKAKEKEFKSYVDEHISNVQKAWDNIKKRKDIIDFICSEDNEGQYILIPTLDMFIMAHDSSKYGFEEWEPSRKKFYSIDEYEKQSCEAEYDRAWVHHYMNNQHHPEYWKDREDDMSLTAVVELCCDWIAMSMKFGGTAYGYFKNKSDAKLGDTQKEWIETILKMYYDIK